MTSPLSDKSMVFTNWLVLISHLYKEHVEEEQLLLLFKLKMRKTADLNVIFPLRYKDKDILFAASHLFRSRFKHNPVFMKISGL